MIYVGIPRLRDDIDHQNAPDEKAEVVETKKTVFGQKDCIEDSIMILALNREKRTERIIIGERIQVELWMAGCADGGFYYDVERPLGTLLLEQRAVQTGEWNQFAGGPLREALQKAEARSELEEEAWNFLEPQLRSPDPIIKFTAFQCWSWYHKYLELQGEVDMNCDYADDYMKLSIAYDNGLNIFWDGDNEAYDYNIKHAWERVWKNMDRIKMRRNTLLDIRYTDQKGGREWLVISGSLYPVIQYYLRQLMDWKLCFCNCSVCKKQFLAPNGHYSLCSKACRTEQNRLNKREFDARAKEKRYEIDYRRIYQHMYYRLNSLKTQENVPKEAWTEVDKQFKVFRNEAIVRKKQIKTEADQKTFREWLYEQEQGFEKFFVF